MNDKKVNKKKLVQYERVEASYSVQAQEVAKCEITLILAEPDQINAVLLSHGVFTLRRRGPESKLGRPQSSVHL